MGIRFKIAIGFVILTIGVISLVSFWGAQSLGFTVESSDLIYLESIKKNVESQIKTRKKLLDKQVFEVGKAIGIAKTQGLGSKKNLKDLIVKLIDNLELAYADLFVDSKSQNSLLPLSIIPETKNGIVRIANTGPLAFSGYIITESLIDEKKNEKFIAVVKPKIDIKNNEVFCIFDNKGVLAGSGFISNYSLEDLKSIKNNNSTKQIRVGDELYRLRCLNLDKDTSIITGYSAKATTTLARSEINSMMARVAVLEIAGFLILGYFWGKRIFAPMKSLQEGIENVSKGKWQTIPPDITENSYEEIGSVAKSFNHMINQLSTARETLIIAQRKLAIKDKMASLGRFSAGIAHEINNPLGTILMSVGMIKESSDKGLPIETEDVATIIEEVKRCRDIIENLRTYTRKTEPNLLLMPFKIFFEESKRTILKQNQTLASKIIFDNQVIENSMISVDKNAMQQVFNNLVKNATEASNGELKIQIVAKSDKDNYKIEVNDNGNGFDCDPEHIFEPMFTTKAQGTGLGLLICQAIIEGHQGHISAERFEKEELTSFCILLPKPKNIS